VIAPRIRAAFVGVALLAGGAPALAAQYPTKPPAPMPLTPAKFPPFQQATLPNGLNILVVENHQHPVVSIRLALPAGTRFDPAGKEGLADFTAQLLTKGTATRSADQISAAIEGVGASLDANAGDDVMDLESTVLADHVDLAFTLIGDVVRNATFPTTEVSLGRTRALSALRVESSSPGSLAARFFAAAIYGNHPYGRHPTEATVGAFDQQAVQAFAAERLRPGGSLLVVSGDITLARVRQLATRTLGPWSGAARAAAAAPAPPKPDATGIILVHRPGSVQSDIVVGGLSTTPADPKRYALVVLNKILGGGTDSRLFQIIREQKSWTYDAHSSLSRPRDIGTFSAGTEVRTPVTDSALVEILKQLRRLRTEPVADSELASAKGFLVGVFPLSIETPQQVAAQVANVRLLGLGADYLSMYRQRIQAVTPAAVQSAAKAFLRPDSSWIVVVGDGGALYDKLAAIAPVRIIDADGKPLTPADLQPKAAAVAWDESQIVARRDSFRLSLGGQALGYWIRSLGPTSVGGKPGLIFMDTTSFGPYGTTVTQLTIDRATVRAVKHDLTGNFAGRTTEVHLTYGSDNHVTGNVNVPRPGGTTRAGPVDTTLAAHVLDEDMILALIEALPLAADARLSVAEFNASSGAVETISIKVSDGGSVTVPAGTFDTWKVDTEGGEAAFTYYVAKSPRRLVKRTLAGQPVVFELVK
jgi:zinc protease